MNETLETTNSNAAEIKSPRPALYSDVHVVCDYDNRRVVWAYIRPLTREDLIVEEPTFSAYDYQSSTTAHGNIMLKLEVEKEMREVGHTQEYNNRYSDFNCMITFDRERDNKFKNVFGTYSHTRKTRNTKTSADNKDKALARHREEFGKEELDALVDKFLRDANKKLADRWARNRYDATRVIGEHYSKTVAVEDALLNERIKAKEEEADSLLKRSRELNKEAREMREKYRRNKLAEDYKDRSPEFIDLVSKEFERGLASDTHILFT